VIFIEILS